jgi:hypothetical protein
VRRVWDFGDGSATVTTTDAKSVAHNYPRAGAYTGQVTTWVLWGSSQVASAPRSFNVAIRDDGRVLIKVTPRVLQKSATIRQVQLVVTASTSGTVLVAITYAGKKGAMTPTPTKLTLKAGQPSKFLLRRVSLRALKSRRATIKIWSWGGLATGMPQPSPVLRPIILR